MTKRKSAQLSLAQKLVYSCYFIVGIGFVILLPFGWLYAKKFLIMRDDLVIAYLETYWVFLLLLPLLGILMLVLLPAKMRYEAGQALFSSKATKHPIRFAKNERARRNKTILTVLCIGILLLNVLILVLSATSYQALTADGYLVKHSLLAGETERVAPSEISHILLKTKYCYPAVYTMGKWTLSVDIETDEGASYSFDLGDFRDIDSMLDFLGQFNHSVIKAEGADSLANIKSEIQFNESQEKAVDYYFFQ